MSIEIRPATPSDVPTILRFIRELAEFEHEPDAVVATDALLHEALFGREHAAHALIALLAGRPVGYAIYFFNFSTWLGRAGLYLEDLYITRSARRSGVGRAALAYLARLAVDRGCARMEWMVLDWNSPAIELYKSLGAVPLEEWTTFRLTGETLASVARMSQVHDR